VLSDFHPHILTRTSDINGSQFSIVETGFAISVSVLLNFLSKIYRDGYTLGERKICCFVKNRR